MTWVWELLGRDVDVALEEIGHMDAGADLLPRRGKRRVLWGHVHL